MLARALCWQVAGWEPTTLHYISSGREAPFLSAFPPVGKLQHGTVVHQQSRFQTGMDQDHMAEVQTAFTSDVTQLKLGCGTRDALRALRLLSETLLSYAEGTGGNTVAPLKWCKALVLKSRLCRYPFVRSSSR